MNDLDSLVTQARDLFASCTTPAQLENAKAQFLGKAGRITEFMKGLSQLDVEAKKTQGAVINAAKQAIDSGAATDLLNRWVEFSQTLVKS